MAAGVDAAAELRYLTEGQPARRLVVVFLDGPPDLVAVGEGGPLLLSPVPVETGEGRPRNSYAFEGSRDAGCRRRRHDLGILFDGDLGVLFDGMAPETNSTGVLIAVEHPGKVDRTWVPLISEV